MRILIKKLKNCFVEEHHFLKDNIYKEANCFNNNGFGVSNINSLSFKKKWLPRKIAYVIATCWKLFEVIIGCET